MKTLTTLTLAVLAGLASHAKAQDAPLFKRLVGNWTFESEAILAPDQPRVKAKGTERVRALGAFWVILEAKLTVMGTPIDAVMTIGTTQSNKILEGAWVSSASGKMVTYKGTLSKDGNTVELATEMPNPMKGGKKYKHKDVISMQGNDRRTLKSFILEDNGKWVEYLSATYKRVKA
jgi:hypothetical protein